MIFQDVHGFPVEEHGDAGDSSVRAGIIMLTGMSTAKSFRFDLYEASYGMLRRHPTQAPWNNKWNFTRDQLIPFVAGLNAAGYHNIIRRIFVMHVLRLGFCQDFQEDAPGTWKYPWLHTYPNGKTKSFDFADPLMPNDWWCLIKGSHLYPLYLLYPVCLLFTFVAMVGAMYHPEQNQIIAELSFHPNWLLKIYTEENLHWRQDNSDYWDSRNEDEYSIALETFVNKRMK